MRRVKLLEQKVNQFQSAPPAFARGDQRQEQFPNESYEFQSAPPAFARGDSDPPVPGALLLSFNPRPPLSRGAMQGNAPDPDHSSSFNPRPPLSRGAIDSGCLSVWK